MRQKDQDDLGALKDDQEPEINPQTQFDSTVWNEIISDLAALTQIPLRAWVKWASVTGTGALDPSLVTHASIWGSGDGQKPTVTRTATGLYTVAYAASFLLGYAEDPGDDETETVSFKDAIVRCSSSDALDLFHDSRKLTLSGATCTLVTKAAGVAADVGNNSAAAFDVGLFLF